jgi:PKD repeat protein
MNRGLALLLLLVLVPAVAYGQASVNVEDVTTVVGGNATMDVTASAVPAPGVTDIQGTITFDPNVMRITALQGLNGFAGFFFFNINNVAGTVAFTGAIIGGNGVTAGGLFRITAEAVGNAGRSCQVSVAMTVFRTGTGTNIAVTTSPGIFSISASAAPVPDFTFAPEEPMLGDVVHFTDASTSEEGVIVARQWSFGDGGVSTQTNPTYQYTNAGHYAVTLRVTDNEGAQSALSKTIVVTGPSAAFTYSPSSPFSQEPIQFLDQSTTPAGQIASWSWTFGDGAVNGSQNPAHTYASSGTYRVDLTVTTSLGVTVSTSRMITVRNALPRAAFTFSPAQPKLGQMVTFSASGSSDSDGNVVMYEWDFNNDGVTDATGATVTHAFTIVGARAVNLKVTDNEGGFDYVTHVVPVQASPPTAEFTFSPQTPNTGQVVSFDASGSVDPDGTIVLYEWDFNSDGNTDATGLMVTHSWPSPGVYPVTLVVTDNDGAVGAVTHGVPVQVGGTSGDNQPPVAEFVFDPAEGPDVNLHEVVTFKADGSSDPDGQIVSYEWDFNRDGIYDATGHTVTHIFHTGGAKIVMLRVTDNEGAHGYKTRVISVVYSRPIAEFTHLPQQPLVGEVVAFDASDSTDPDGTVEFFEWDFTDDGVADATGQSVNRVFAQGGSVPVTLTVTDNDGISSSITRVVNVAINNPPVASFEYEPESSLTVASTIQFTDTSEDSDGAITGHLWDFGDGGSSTAQNPTHMYDEPGTYTVTLTVTDDEGATGQATEILTVQDAPDTLIADFTFSPARPTIEADVQFADGSSVDNGSIVAWAWDFGDGTEGSTQRNPKHRFATRGSYNVTLIVTDNLGREKSAAKQVVVGTEASDVVVFAYPNPAAEATMISFQLPDGTSNTELWVFDLKGRPVLSRQLAGGETEYWWDLRDQDGNRVSNGMYFCVVTATGGNDRVVKSLPFRLLISR